MDEQIQHIINQATMPQATMPASNDPISAILQSAGVAPQTPSAVNSAESQLGSQDDNGMCQRFAEKITGSQNHYGSAAEAWNAAVKEGKAYADITKAPQGSLIYYSPDGSNKGFGHVAVTDGKGNQIGATDSGVTFTPIQQWTQSTGQKPLGYVIP